MVHTFTLELADDAMEVADFRCRALGGRVETAAKDLARHMRHGQVWVARSAGEIVASLCLTPKKPWAIDASRFTPVRTPLYLIAMAVAPPLRGRGIGRRCLLEVDTLAARWPAQAIRLDAHDHPTGAGGFYQRCGYREVGRAVYRNTPLIYLERMIGDGTAV